MKTALILLASISLLSFISSAESSGSATAARRCIGEVVRFTQMDFQVQTLRYQPTQPGQKTIVILPPTGGTNFIDRGYSELFCKAGFDVHVLDHWTGDDEYNLDLEIHQRFYSRVQKGIGLILENVNSPFIGILGTSVGGLHTAVAMGSHDRLDAAFVIVAGAPIAEIIVYSDQEILVDAKRKRFELFKFRDDQEYAQSLDRVFAIDPLKLPRLFHGKPLGMVISTNDSTVPTKNQRDLQNLWQPQTVYERSTTHTATVVRTWIFEKHKVLGFFQKAVVEH